jgi:hypothetical protein
VPAFEDFGKDAFVGDGLVPENQIVPSDNHALHLTGNVLITSQRRVVSALWADFRAGGSTLHRRGHDCGDEELGLPFQR